MVDEAETFMRAQRTANRVKIALVIAVLLAPAVYLLWRIYAHNAGVAEEREQERRAEMLSAVETAQLRDGLARAHQASAARRAAFAADVVPTKLEAVTPSDAPCPVSLRAPTAGAADSYVRYGSIDGNYFGNVAYREVEPGSSIRPPTDDDTSLDGIDAALARGEATRTQLHHVARLERDADDVVLVVATRKPALIVADSYEPGTISGNAYIYSYSQRRIVCFAEVSVRNSAEIKFEYSAQLGADENRQRDETARYVLERDLEVQLRRQLATRMRATEH
jgi:hypothetical protein